MTEIRITKVLGHLVFLIMLVYACVFFFERMNSDTSFFTFKILSFEKFNIEAGRYSSFITQIIPLALMKLHAGLKVILISYSVSFVIVFYSVFLLCMYAFSSLRAAIAATFVVFLGISDTSMYSGTEIHFGMMSAALFYAYLEYFLQQEKTFSVTKKVFFVFLGILIILLCLFNHPSTLFPLVFILMFQAIDKKLYASKTLYILGFVVVIAYGLKYLSIDENSYEANQLAPFYNLFSILGNFIHTNSVHFFLKFVWKGVYVLPLLLFAITLGYYLIKKEYLKLSFYFVSTIGFFVLLMVIFSPGDSDLGMERNLIPLWFFIGLPFAHDVLFHEFRFPYMRPIVYSLVIIAGFAGFYRATVLYKERTDYMWHIIREAARQTGSGKIIIEKKNLQMDKLMGSWTFATETLLMSAMEGPQNAKTIYLVDNLEQLKDIDLTKTEMFLCVPFWIEWGYPSLNQEYFQLPSQPYSILENPIPLN